MKPGIPGGCTLLALVPALAVTGCRCADDRTPAAADAGGAAAAASDRSDAAAARSAAARLARAVRAGNARLVSLPPGTPRQTRNLEQGKAMLQAGDKEAATAHFQAASHGPLTGARVSALLALGDVYREQDRLQECVAIHEEAARIAVGVPEVQLQLGRAYTAMGRLAKGEEALRRAVHLEPRLLAAWVDLGALLARSGRQEEAAQALLTYEKYLFDLVGRLRDGDEADRLAAVDALSLTSDDKAVEALTHTLADPSAQVRAAAAEALGDSAAVAAFTAIEAHLASERSEEVRTALRQAASRLRVDLTRLGKLPAAAPDTPAPAEAPAPGTSAEAPAPAAKAAPAATR